MGRFLVALAAAALVPGTLAAQLSIGARGGLNVTTISGDEVEDVERLNGPTFGGLLTLSLTESVAIDLGANWSPKGANLAFDDESPTRADIRVGYIDFPIHLRAELARSDNLGIHLLGGPTVSYNHSCEVESEALPGGGKVDCDDEIFGEEAIDPATVDFGLTLGGGLSVEAGDSGARLMADLLYTIGLKDIVENDDARHRALSLLAGFRIPVG